jgi:hypothetical protein
MMQFKIFMNIILVSVTVVTSSCGTSNFFDCDSGYADSKCARLTKDEEARIALDRGDMATAVELLAELVADEPDVYERYLLLAAAYAGKSGLDIFNVVTANFGSDNSILQIMDAFIPTPTTLGSAYESSLRDMNFGIQTLISIPPNLRIATSSNKYATSAVLQLTLYQAAFGVMLLNKFSYGSNGYDPSLLASMTAEDAAMILNAFLGAAEAAGGSAATSVISALSDIQSQPGSSDQEKLAAWAQAAR